MSALSTLNVAGWIIFWIYWLVSAFGSKKNAVSPLKQFMAVRIVILILALILFRLNNVRNYSFQGGGIFDNTSFSIVGFLIFLLGLMLAVWARLCLGKNWGMPMTQKQNPELITTGPYRYIRHPIYTGILTAMLGSALVNSLFWLLVMGVSMVYFIYSAFIEEKTMIRQFPDVYPAYKRKTKMLIPFLL